MELPRWILLATLGVFLTWGGACPAANDDDAGDDDTAPPVPNLRVASYNLGLTEGEVEYVAERLPAQGLALAGLDADVLCLQEVWGEGDVAAIGAATAGPLPHAYWVDSRPDVKDLELLPPPCEDLTALAACATEFCDGLAPEDLTMCVVANCVDEFEALSADCVDCLVDHLSEPFDAIIATCTAGTPPPVSRDGLNGLLLLADRELLDAQKLDLESFWVLRRVLYARVDTDGGPVHLFCTQLASDLEAEMPYAGSLGSYEAENAAQIEALLQHVDQLAAGELAVILGDLGTGPGSMVLDGTWPAHYDTLLAQGWAAPYVEAGPGDCTYCADNTLAGTSRNDILDHALFAGFDPAASYEAARIFDQEVEVEVAAAVQMMPLSDHYGVLVTAPISSH